MIRASWRVAAIGGAMALATSLTGVSVGHAAPAKAKARFDRPTAIAIAHNRIWIANAGNDSVVELNAAGHTLNVFKAASYHFSSPDAITIAQGNVFVANHSSITELRASTGKLVRVIRGRKYDLDVPVAMAVSGNSLWAVDSGSNAVTRIRISDGSLFAVVSNASNPPNDLDEPVALAIAHHEVWVVNQTGSVTVFKANNFEQHVASLKAPRFGFAAPEGIAYDGHDLWVTDSGTDAVTELTTSRSLVRIISNSSPKANYGFDAPSQVVAHGNDIYVISPPGASPMITKVGTATGKGHWYECNTNSPDPEFANPTGIAVAHHREWVVSPANNSLDELGDAHGTLLHHFV